MYSDFDKSRFTPITINSGNSFFQKWVRNPTKEEKLKYGYVPRLTLFDRPSGQVLHIEFSVPKLLFGNNFQELEDNDFENVIITLQNRLKDIGILIFHDLLKKAPVSGIHYSKNFLLTDGSLPSLYIDAVRKSNITKRWDIEESKYRNEGYGFKCHTNTFELAFYDKIQDMKKSKISEKRTFEKNNYIQLELLNTIDIEKKRKPFEILRMEVRLNNRTKIKQVFKKNNIAVDFTFIQLFQSELSQKILLGYFNDILDSMPTMIDSSDMDSKKFFGQFRMNNPKTSLVDVFSAYGFYKAINKIGVRELRACFESESFTKWYRYYKKMSSYSYPKKNFRSLDVIKQHLLEFEPVNHLDFPEGMLNNDKYE